jgi:hypothetical protein
VSCVELLVENLLAQRPEVEVAEQQLGREAGRGIVSSPNELNDLLLK